MWTIDSANTHLFGDYESPLNASEDGDDKDDDAIFNVATLDGERWRMRWETNKEDDQVCCCDDDCGYRSHARRP